MNTIDQQQKKSSKNQQCILNLLILKSCNNFLQIQGDLKQISLKQSKGHFTLGKSRNELSYWWRAKIGPKGFIL
jgi:hypothetical protein